jgi:hypothetical protein
LIDGGQRRALAMLANAWLGEHIGCVLQRRGKFAHCGALARRH